MKENHMMAQSNSDFLISTQTTNHYTAVFWLLKLGLKYSLLLDWFKYTIKIFSYFVEILTYKYMYEEYKRQ